MTADAPPEPVVTAQVCSVCGLPWDDHGERPTIAKCVDLLKAALALARPQMPVWNLGQIGGVRSGWSCGVCGAWVPAGTMHSCGGRVT